MIVCFFQLRGSNINFPLISVICHTFHFLNEGQNLRIDRYT
jgi:hypothetical protein